MCKWIKPATGGSAWGQAKENLDPAEGGATANPDEWSLGPTATVTMGDPQHAKAVIN